jgi:hypothetical protein
MVLVKMKVLTPETPVCPHLLPLISVILCVETMIVSSILELAVNMCPSFWEDEDTGYALILWVWDWYKGQIQYLLNE